MYDGHDRRFGVSHFSFHACLIIQEEEGKRELVGGRVVAVPIPGVFSFNWCIMDEQGECSEEIRRGKQIERTGLGV
jgi:hypothetical protein